MQIYDISRTLDKGIEVWPGDPEFYPRWAMRIRDGETCNVAEIHMGVHTGTHIDAPLHLDDSGIDVSSIPIRNCIGPARVFSMAAEKCIRAADLEALDWRGVERALFKTRSRRPEGQPFSRSYVYFAEDAAEFLARHEMYLVGTDGPSVDAFESELLPSHTILLGRGTVILEDAQLEKVPPGDYELFCLPLKLAGLDGSPVRAILRKR
jgi:arylformamidase